MFLSQYLFPSVQNPPVHLLSRLVPAVALEQYCPVIHTRPSGGRRQIFEPGGSVALLCRSRRETEKSSPAYRQNKEYKYITTLLEYLYKNIFQNFVTFKRLGI